MLFEFEPCLDFGLSVYSLDLLLMLIQKEAYLFKLRIVNLKDFSSFYPFSSMIFSMARKSYLIKMVLRVQITIKFQSLNF